MDEALINLVLQVGVPAAIGLFCVVYLIKVIIPKQMDTIDRQAEIFKGALEKQQETFDTALKHEQQVHREMLSIITDTIREQSQYTRDTLNELDRSMKDMTKALYKLYGAIGPNGKPRS